MIQTFTCVQSDWWKQKIKSYKRKRRTKWAMICNWKEWVDSLERSNTKTMKEKRGKFRILFFRCVCVKKKKLHFSLFFLFWLFINTMLRLIRNNERNFFPMMMIWRKTITYVYVTNSLWSKRIVLGYRNYDIRTSDVCTFFGRMSVKLLGTHTHTHT